MYMMEGFLSDRYKHVVLNCQASCCTDGKAVSRLKDVSTPLNFSLPKVLRSAKSKNVKLVCK